MGVVFDEVIANVEAPQPVRQERAANAPPSTQDDEQLKLEQALETRERRQLRLQAD